MPKNIVNNFLTLHMGDIFCRFWLNKEPFVEFRLVILRSLSYGPNPVQLHKKFEIGAAGLSIFWPITEQGKLFINSHLTFDFEINPDVLGKSNSVTNFVIKFLTTKSSKRVKISSFLTWLFCFRSWTQKYDPDSSAFFWFLLNKINIK